jgi:DHA2 family multidrug resistance protein-like MFS transporter
MSAATVPAKATRREWIGLAVIALPCVLYSMDLTVLNLALPQISVELNPGAAQLLWIVDIYGFLLAGFLIPMGALGDRIGRRRLLMIGAAAFGVASVFAAFARSAEALIVARAALGVAGATLAPSTLSLIRNMFHDADERTFAIGVWITSYSLGGAIGPLVGGVLLEYFWWGSVFLVSVPIMVLLLATAPLLMPEYRDPNARSIDLTSAAMSLVAVLLVIYGVKRIAEAGASWPAASAIVAGCLLAALFVRRQRHLADPLIDLELFRRPAFPAALAIYLLGTFILFGIFVFIAQHLQLVLGLVPLKAGLWTVPSMLAFVAGSMQTPRLIRRFRPPTVVTAGMVAAALGCAVLAGTGGGEHALATLVAGSVILSLGMAPVFTLSTDLVVGTAPPERAGAAGALSETSSELGGALGIAVLGSLGAVVYQTGMSSDAIAALAGTSAEAARSTLGGAAAAAAQLAEPQQRALLESARASFTQAFQVVAWVAAGIAAIAACLNYLLLRSQDSTSRA